MVYHNSAQLCSHFAKTGSVTSPFLIFCVNFVFMKDARLVAWRPKSPLCTEHSMLQAEAVQVLFILPVTLFKHGQLLFEGYSIFHRITQNHFKTN